MSILNSNYKITEESFNQQEDTELDDIALEQLYTVTLLETLNPEEIEELLTESVTPFSDVVLERSIVKLDKAAKFKRAIQAAKYQLAREDNSKILKMLTILWKKEAVLDKKLDKLYLPRAKRRAREMVNNLSKNKLKSKIIANAGNRINNIGNSGLVPVKHTPSK